MSIQQPNLGTFTKADYKLLQRMSDNDDAIRSDIEKLPKGIITLGLLDNIATDLTNYSYTLTPTPGYVRHNSVNWIDVNLADPKDNRLTVNFESSRYYKFLVHLDYVWAANNNPAGEAAEGRSGRIEIRLRDMTHRHDLLYWTNVVDPDYNIGGIESGQYAVRDKVNNANVNIWNWNEAAAKGCVPSSCNAVRVMAAKTSGAAVIKLQYRPINAFGGIVPPLFMNCDQPAVDAPAFGLPTQYLSSGVTFNTESVKQFKGYIAVEDCGPVEKPSGVAPGVQDDNSVSPLFEAYENHPYDSSATGRP
jgi:hypothetical protein